MVAGADKSEELLAGPRPPVAVEGQVPQGLVPRGTRGRLDAQAFLAGAQAFLPGRRLGIALTDQRIDDDRHLAELEQVALLQGPLSRTQTHAVEPRAVGAAQVADAPAPLGQADFGVVAADRTLIQHDLERIETADPKEVGRLPAAALDGPVETS